MSDKLVNKDSFALVEGTNKTEHEALAASHASLEADHEALKTTVNGLVNSVGGPLIAETVADMTDTSKVYVYVGSESGYTAGNWYYYNGSSWVSGGVYNSTAIDTDETLSVSGMAADSATVGDELRTISGLLLLAPKNAGVFMNNGDLDDLLSSYLPYGLNTNSTRTIRGDYTYYNSPERSGFVLTIQNESNDTDNGKQVFFGESGNVYTRNKTDGSWSDWTNGIDDTLTSDNASANAKTVGDILYGGAVHEGITPSVRKYWSSAVYTSENKFFVADMPRNSYTRCSSAVFADVPEDIAAGSVYVERFNSNVAGNISIVRCISAVNSAQYWSNFSETGGTISWHKVVDHVQLRTITNDIEDLNDDITELSGKTLKSTEATIYSGNVADYFDDANYAPWNSVYYISSSAEMKNTPYGNGYSTGAGDYDGTVRSVTGYLNGTLITYGNSETKRVQLFISGGTPSEPSASILYYRSEYGTNGGSWTEWHMLSDRASITGSNVVIRKKLIAPYEDSDGNPTATDTGIVNHQRIENDPFYFSDFNDAPLNSIIQVDLDCDASVMANNPLSGRSNILMTWCWSYVRRHAVVQFCVGLNPNDAGTGLFYRYGYANTSTDYRWTDWESAQATTDTTLTKNGRPADSKAVGDKLAELEARIAALEA